MPALTKGKRRLMGDINVVPYIDVMLVLLIIFMITAPLLTQGIKVDLPKAAAEPIPAQANQTPLGLSIDAHGQLYLNLGANPRQPIDDQTALVRATAALGSGPGRGVRGTMAIRGSTPAGWCRRWSFCNKPAPTRSASRPIRCQRRRPSHDRT